MHIFYKKKISKLNYIYLKLFWWLHSNFAIFSCTMSVIFESNLNILCEEEDEENFQLEKKIKFFFFFFFFLDASILFFFPFTPLYL